MSRTAVDPALAGRRHFMLASSAVAGGFALGWADAAQASAPSSAAVPAQAGTAQAAGALAFTDWVRITRDNQVMLVLSQAEMGQGISTTLPALLADELGADWTRIRLELAPVAAAYRNPRANWMFTGNSESAQSFFDLMRRVGASARQMLCAAAAERWGVSPESLTTRAGAVIHAASGRSASFGDLAEAAARQPLPSQPTLRDARELTLIGRSLPRVDQAPKTDGSAPFGIDYLPPGLTGTVFAAVRSGPAYGARPLAVTNLDALRARAGVIDVVLLPTAVAVVAEKYWQARAALALAQVQFDAGPHAALSSATLRQQYRDRLRDGPFKLVRDLGDANAPTPASRVEATYALPFQAHATLEPMNALAHVTAGGVDVWAPTQGQDLARLAVAGALGRKAEDVRIHRSPFLGGGFGRRLLPDFVVEAALLSQRVGRPVKLIWSREEDLRRDYFRPATLHAMRADLDGAGNLLGLSHRLVSPTILKPVFPPLDLSTGVDPSTLEGLLHTRYRIGRWRTEFHLLETPVPTSVYRTTGYGPTIFGLESFIDELAHRARRDPYLYRRALLAHDARATRVLDEAARRAAWASPLPRGRGRGIAFTDAFGTLLAQVVEVTVRQRRLTVDRIVTVADPGRVLDPGITEAGLEGGAIWALSSALKGEITFANGGPVQTNFHEYDLLRLRETPRFETHLLESPDAPLGGIGEVGPVATVPALANALFHASGRRLRELPLARAGLALA